MRTFVKGAVTLCALTLVFSCKTMKYSRPDIPEIQSLYGNAVSADTTSIADIGWEDFFKDPLLQKIIRTALENNADIRIAAQKVIEANASLKAAKLSYLPYVGLKPSASYANAERYGGNAYGYVVPGLTFSWEADINGKITSEKNYAKSAAEQAVIYRRSVETAVVCAVANYYYTLQMLDAQLDVSRKTAASWAKNVEAMKAMKDAGMTNEASVSQTEANKHAIDASLFELEYKISTTESALCTLLGIAGTKIERNSFKEENLCRELMAGVPAQLLSRRPDVMHAELEFKKAFYNVHIATCAFYPSLVISGDFNWEKVLTAPASMALSLTGGLIAPLFNKGKNKANLTLAKARQEEAFISFRQTLLQAGKEVNDALALCKAADCKTEFRKMQIESLEKAETSTKELMKHSESTYLEVLTAQQSLLSARLLQISDHFDTVSGIISLYRALGGGYSKNIANQSN